MAAPELADSAASVLEAFKEHDLEHTGLISWDVLKSLFQTLDNKRWTDDTVEALIATAAPGASANSEGVAYEAFVAWLFADADAADVARFKQTREFGLLKECVSIVDSLPYVATDVLDNLGFERIARFLDAVGLLAEFLAIESQKVPIRFDVDIIRRARNIKRKIAYNGEEYPYHEGLQKAARTFLQAVDNKISKISSQIEPRLKDDFAAGVGLFKAELRESLLGFDAEWRKFQHEYDADRK